MLKCPRKVSFDTKVLIVRICVYIVWLPYMWRLCCLSVIYFKFSIGFVSEDREGHSNRLHCLGSLSCGIHGSLCRIVHSLATVIIIFDRFSSSLLLDDSKWLWMYGSSVRKCVWQLCTWDRDDISLTVHSGAILKIVKSMYNGIK
jgi:hypothetical protein